MYATIDGNAYDVAARSCARWRVVAIGQTAAVGLLLQRHRVGLPEDIEHHQEERRVVEQRTRLVQEEMFDLDEQRLILADVGARTTELLAGPDRLRGEPNDEVVSSVRSMLETQPAYLGLLFDDQARYFDVLIRLGTTYGELNGTAEAFLRFIDERVLWTRNAEPMGWSDLVLARDAGAWLLQPGQWLSLARALGSDSVTNPWRYAPLLGLLLGSGFFWRRARAALAACGERAAAGSARRYSLTVQGLLLTLAVSVPGPAATWLLARRLATADASPFAAAVAAALAVVAATYLPLEIIRQASRPRGLMVAHFRWSARAAAVLRRHLGWFAGASLPSVFVFAAMTSQGVMKPGNMPWAGSRWSACRSRAPSACPACCILTAAYSSSCSRWTGTIGSNACAASGTAERSWRR